jgi:hypothetical protein
MVRGECLGLAVDKGHASMAAQEERRQAAMCTDEFRQKQLRVHSLLHDVPLRSLSRVDLPGGRAGMTLQEIMAVVGFGSGEDIEVGPVTHALFWLRAWIGRLLHWDEAKALAESISYLSRLSEADRACSLVTPGRILRSRGVDCEFPQP